MRRVRSNDWTVPLLVLGVALVASIPARLVAGRRSPAHGGAW
ncbi:hypothetical protein [Microbacterium sp. 69-10]|nr:hypothetical protein [Microbacterium sp. 69-10]